jgi:photosystem II stability/assembly factor-like uncharacterized protein
MLLAPNGLKGFEMEIMSGRVQWFKVVFVVLLCLPRSGVAQTLVRPPPAEAYVWRNVAIGGGGFVTGIIFHPHEQNLMYARTDVGGAYRWDDSRQKWAPITDWIGAAENNLMGIESIALDPADPKRVYLAAGTYGGSAAAILRSDDQGRTFQKTAVPFKMGGNETGRFNGERLAVDPGDGDILFFGSRRDGLWRSDDRGVTWRQVQSFPNISAHQPSPDTAATVTTNSRPRFRRGFGQSSAGIVSVVFDAASGKTGQPTSKIFAAVSTAGTNLFFSMDAGVTWQGVPNQPIGLLPNHLVLAPDGFIYLSYGREPGPNSMNDGAVWKFDPKTNSWTNISPLKSPDGDQPFGFGAVAVDPQHPSTLMVTTFAHWHPHDFIFRSTDGGATWKQLWRDDTQWDYASAPYTRSRSPHWLGSVVINPANSDQVLFTTGYGIWSCFNMTEADSGKPTRWVFLDSGIEETVPLALLSPPEGAHLLSGVGDIDGFRHDDLNVSPAGGTFSGPRYSNTEDLALAGQNPAMMVRTGTGRPPMVRGAYSRDGGATWQALKSEPSAGNGGGTIAISADGKTIVWTPQGGAPYFTTDEGTNWTACAGLPAGIRVVADTVNPQKFCAFDARSVQCFGSTNRAVSFNPVAVLSVAQKNNGYGFDGRSLLTATPGVEDDFWIASRFSGLFHTTNGWANFTRLDRVQVADSVGLGKAAPGKPYPAVFLAGKVGGLQALFRSDDAGDTWVRINDDQHQYGFLSGVTGDPRIYGRVYFATGGRGVIYGDISRVVDVEKK